MLRCRIALATPGETGRTAGPRVLARTESLRTQSGTIQGGPRHDQWAKLGLIRHTISHYTPVMIPLFSIKFIAQASKKITVKRAPLSQAGRVVGPVHCRVDRVQGTRVGGLPAFLGSCSFFSNASKAGSFHWCRIPTPVLLGLVCSTTGHTADKPLAAR
jgi:hypothetical protein